MRASSDHDGVTGTAWHAHEALQPRCQAEFGVSKAGFTRAEWRRLAAFYGAIAGLHLIGAGIVAAYATRHPALAGLGLAAYLFGLRHAFDADHIAAIDDTVRYLTQQGQRPLGCGFFFSLGHSTIVLLLSLATAGAATWVKRHLPGMESLGAVLGTAVSGAFLLLIGLLNLVVLLDLLRVWGRSRASRHRHPPLDDLVNRGGFINRILGGRLATLIHHSGQMYPLGLLFGLGFDTASEVALLAMAAGAAAGDLPMAAVVALPILFAAGMCLMDTSDGVLMCRAYHWALANPLRRVFYNLTTTSLSVIVALGIGSVELVQVMIRLLGWDGPMSRAISEWEIGRLGLWIVAAFIFAWSLSLAAWKLNRTSASETSIGP